MRRKRRLWLRPQREDVSRFGVRIATPLNSDDMKTRLPARIFTLTFNLLAERTLTFERWSPGRTQRATGESFQVGGKGINVVKMLKRLGAPPATALCFTGGATGDECEDWLRKNGLRHTCFAAASATRAGTVIRTRGAPETTFLGPDVPIDARAIRMCAKFLRRRASGSLLALCGSVPGWESPDFDPLRQILSDWNRHGLLVADTYGPPLAWMASQPLTLLRVNRTELLSLFPDAGSAPTSTLLKEARRKFSVSCWVVSDGPSRVWVMDEDGVPASLKPPRVREISATGSGDVMLACILHARFCRGMGWKDAVAWAIPQAAANAAHPGIAEFPGIQAEPDIAG